MDFGPVLGTWRQALTVDFLRYFLTAAPVLCRLLGVAAGVAPWPTHPIR